MKKIDLQGRELSDLNTIVNILSEQRKEDSVAAERAGLITDAYYFEGDYTKTYEVVEGYTKSKEEYELVTNNCVQKTLGAFIASDKRFYDVAYGLPNNVIPNAAASKVALLPRKKSDIPWLLILYNLFLE